LQNANGFLENQGTYSFWKKEAFLHAVR
jgi:hypothetical protein